MATRHQQQHVAVAAPQGKRGVAMVGKGKAAPGAEAKNRRALGDIGNMVNTRGVVVEGKQLLQINRPITRSFGAQLLANAQAAAATKKPVAIPVDGAVAKVGTKPVALKVTIKSKADVNVGEKPKQVIEITSDTDEESMITCESSDNSSCSKPSKKKQHTLTSVLTARSKAACGVLDKPKESICDIDAADAKDQLAVAEYVEDIYKFYKLAEHSSRPYDYIDSQLEINAKMRAILTDWLIEVHQKFELMPETLFLTIYIIDRFLSMEAVLRRELQLVGVSALLIASKYEEIWAPEVNDFIIISDKAYTREQILAMEKRILNRLEWNLTVPTPYVFLVRFLKAALCDKEMENMVFFLAELGLMQYPMIMYCPSMFAASSVYAARCTLKKNPLWTETLKCHTGFSEDQLIDCAQILVDSHSAAPENKLKVVYKKYAGEQFGSVALQSPATKMLEELKLARK